MLPISTLYPGTTILILVGITLLLLRVARIGRREAGLPPGPPTVPGLGNATEIPRQRAYLKFAEWAKKYGGIYSLKILSTTIIVVSDPATVYELFEKRSASSADRPFLYLGTLVNEGMSMPMASYGKIWKLLRRCANEILSPAESDKFIPIQQAETSQLMYDVLKRPEDFYRHIARFANSIVMSITYGIRTPRYETRHATNFYEMAERWLNLMAPGAHPPVDQIPILRYIPERWASWKTECREVRQMQRQLYFRLLDQVEERMRQGEENGSFMGSLLKQKRNQMLQMDYELMAYLGGVMLEGGSETTTGFLRSLILMLVENPEVVRKAQREIDEVVGGERVPAIEDADQLPYIQAIVKEIFRFRPMTPLIPHALLSNEAYLNYHLPKGATLMLNVWGIFHDPEIFDNPDSFEPERYLLSEFGTKPGYNISNPRWNNLPFGAGRRICPGLHLANNTLLLATMNMIWGFNFLRPLDKDGEPVPLDVGPSGYSLGITIEPNPFSCRIIPRNEKKAFLIEANFAEAMETLAKFECGLDGAERTVL